MQALYKDDDCIVDRRLLLLTGRPFHLERSATICCPPLSWLSVVVIYFVSACFVGFVQQLPRLDSGTGSAPCYVPATEEANQIRIMFSPTLEYVCSIDFLAQEQQTKLRRSPTFPPAAVKTLIRLFTNFSIHKERKEGEEGADIKEASWKETSRQFVMA